MRFVLFSKSPSGLMSLNMGHNKFYILAMVGILSFSMAVFYGGFYLSTKLNSSSSSNGKFTSISAKMVNDRKSFLRLKQQYEMRIDKLSERLGMVKGEIMHLNALAKRLTRLANIEVSEFNFENPPSVGGPIGFVSLTKPMLGGFFIELNAYDKMLQERESKLGEMEKIILKNKTKTP